MNEWLVFSLLLVMGVSSGAGQCPTWFKETENGSCECGHDLGAVIRCDKNTKKVSIRAGYCMTYDSSSEELLVGFANYYGYMGGRDRAYSVVPTIITTLNDTMCTKYGKRGFLCGECIDPLGVPINSLFNECVKCKELYAVGMYLLLVIIPITIFFILVVMFRFNFTSGPFLGYIIFCQLLVLFIRKRLSVYQFGLEEMDVHGQTVANILLSLSGIWLYSMSVFRWISPLCLHKSMTNIQVVCLDYIFVVYPLFLLIITYVCIELHARDFRLVVYLWKPFHKCFAKVRRNWSTSDSIIHAYATFFFLSFLSLVTISFDVLWATDVYSINGTITRTVVIMDTKMERFSPQHLQYVVPTMTILFFLGFCPTLILCLVSTRLFAKCFRFGPRTQLFLQTFADVFQSCYKDGLNGTWDFRFLSSAPMFVYLFAVVLSSFVVTPTSNFWIVSGIILFITSCGFAYVKPYKSGYMNFSLSFHFLVMGVIAVMLCLWFNDSAFNSHSLAITLTFLVSLPHLLVLFTLLYYVLMHINLTRFVIQRATEKMLTVFHQKGENLTASSPDRLENSYAYRPLPDV